MLFKDRRNCGTIFGAFLKKHRDECGFTLMQLSRGLCSPSGLARIEEGTRTAGKVLRDRLLCRLGISPDDYEHFLFEEEYLPWKKRQQLLYMAVRENAGEAYGHLQEYKRQYVDGEKNEVERRVEQQFCLAMEAQILQSIVPEDTPGLQGKLEKLFREALELTIDIGAFESGTVHIDSEDGCQCLASTGATGQCRGEVYSVQELNLLLEWISYRKMQDREAYERKILRLVGESKLDKVSRAKIYPKAVYCLCRDGVDSGAWGLAEKMDALVLCEDAVQCLRLAGRLYYLWELLKLSERLAEEVAVAQYAVGGVEKAKELEEKVQEWQECGDALRKECGKAGVPVETKNFYWLYVEKEVYCINDVIRVRRGMLGMTRKQLYADGFICSEKTLERLESGRKSVRIEVAMELMERLGMAAEYCRTELVTDDSKAVEVLSDLRIRIRDREHEKADQLLNQLERRIPLDIPSNKQAWMRIQAVNEVHKGTITREQGIERVKKALACTMSYETILKPGKKYLTNEEIFCIQNMVCWNKGVDEEKKKQIAVLEEFYETCEKDQIIFCFINMYEVIMDRVASEWGEMGEYDRSDEISRNIIKECLYQRRSYGIHRGIYNIMWNVEQRRKKGIPYRSQSTEEDLKSCIIFSMLGMEKHNEEFYRKKLQALKSK